MMQLNYVKLMVYTSRVLIQQCIGIYFSLDGYEKDNVIYKWKDGAGKVEKKSIAQFDMNEVELNSITELYVSG